MDKENRHCKEKNRARKLLSSDWCIKNPRPGSCWAGGAVREVGSTAGTGPLRCSRNREPPRHSRRERLWWRPLIRPRQPPWCAQCRSGKGPPEAGCSTLTGILKTKKRKWVTWVTYKKVKMMKVSHLTLNISTQRRVFRTRDYSMRILILSFSECIYSELISEIILRLRLLQRKFVTCSRIKFVRVWRKQVVSVPACGWPTLRGSP